MTTREVLRLPGVRCLWLAQFVSILGDYVALYAVLAAVAFAGHRDAGAVALVWIAFLAPLAVFGPLGGTITDRYDARKVMIAADVLRAVVVSLLPFARSTAEYCVLIGAISALSSVFLPAQAVLVRRVVPGPGLAAANAYTAQATQVIAMTTPVLAAFAIHAIGPQACYVYDALSFLASALLLGRIDVPLPNAAEPRRPPGLRDGLRYLLGERRLAVVLLSLTAGMALIRGPVSLMPIYVRDDLARSVLSFGAFASLSGAGTIAGAQFAKRALARWGADDVILAGLAANALGLLLLGFTHEWAVAASACALMGAGGGAAVVAAQTRVQHVTPWQMLGRLSGTLLALSAASQLVGTMAGGTLTRAVPVHALFGGAGTVLALVVGAAALRPAWASAGAEPSKR